MNLYMFEIEYATIDREGAIPVVAPDSRKALAVMGFAVLQGDDASIKTVELIEKDVADENIPDHALRWTPDDGVAYNFLNV